MPWRAVLPEQVDHYGANISRNVPRARPMPTLSRPVAKTPPPPAPSATNHALEGRSYSPRSVSPVLFEVGNSSAADTHSGAFSIASGSCTHISASPNATPRSSTQENPDWYLTEVALPPTSPANLHLPTDVFEIQSNDSDDTIASWYNLK